MLRQSFCLLLACVAASAFYLPGVAPISYAVDEPLALLVNRLDSSESIVPYDYYYFDFCEPGEDESAAKAHEGAKVSENLGQILLGERIRTSPFKIHMMQMVACQPLCRPKVYTLEDKKSVAKLKKLEKAIKLDYMQHWIMDNLPAVECTSDCDTEKPFYRTGFPVGCKIGAASQSMTVCTAANIANLHADDIFINNHVDITIKFHQSSEFSGSRIVGVEIKPRSIKHAALDKLDCNEGTAPQSIKLDAQNPKVEVIYTYSVEFVGSELKWASRWDSYLQSAEGTSIHWFSIVNSSIIVLFLTGMLAVIFVRTIYRDIARYNQVEASEEAQEEFGWKLVHGDVFRPPTQVMLLSVLVGSGLQVVITFLITLVFACLGFLSPATRGGMMTTMVLLWVALGTLAGFVSARLYKTLGGEQWKTNVILTAFLIPGLIFVIFFLLNLILWYLQSSAAIPFGTLVALIVLWFCVSVPLTFLGAYLGFKRNPIEPPCRTNPIPRQVPPQPFYTQPLTSILMGGILPFGCIFIQLFFIMNSIWGHKLYYVFGFLFVVFLILVVTVIESVMLLCYFHLCAEDYHWWWRSFLTGASCALYLFLYSVAFYFKRMEVDGAVNFVLYAGYTLIATLLFAVATGTVGFFGCYGFVRKIYGVIKIDQITRIIEPNGFNNELITK